MFTAPLKQNEVQAIARRGGRGRHRRRRGPAEHDDRRGSADDDRQRRRPSRPTPVGAADDGGTDDDGRGCDDDALRSDRPLPGHRRLGDGRSGEPAEGRRVHRRRRREPPVRRLPADTLQALRRQRPGPRGRRRPPRHQRQRSTRTTPASSSSCSPTCPRSSCCTNWVDRAVDGGEQRADPLAAERVPERHASATGTTWRRSARATATPRPTASTSAPTAPTTTRR